jgi:hypothetical protein
MRLAEKWNWKRQILEFPFWNVSFVKKIGSLQVIPSENIFSNKGPCQYSYLPL